MHALCAYLDNMPGEVPPKKIFCFTFYSTEDKNKHTDLRVIRDYLDKNKIVSPEDKLIYIQKSLRSAVAGAEGRTPNLLPLSAIGSTAIFNDERLAALFNNAFEENRLDRVCLLP